MRGAAKQLILIGAALAAIGLFVPAADASTCAAQNNYTGAAGGQWNLAANWSKGTVPTSAETACIPTEKGTVTIAAAVKAEVNTLLSQSALTIASTATLAISEKFAMEETKVNEERASRFADLTVDGTLSTAGDWLMMSGNVVVEGEITSSAKSEDTARLLGGTLSGNGTIDIPFSNIAGAIQPGGAGVIGEAHFTSLSAAAAGATLVLDIKSASEFDRLSDTTSNFFFNEGTEIEVNLLGGYEPPVKTKWDIMSGGPGDPVDTTNVEPGSFIARSFSGGFEVERTLAPPSVVTDAGRRSPRPRQR